jgi:hypothetical protein
MTVSSLTYPYLSKIYLEIQQDVQWLLRGLEKEFCIEYKEEGGVAYEIVGKCFCETTKCRAWVGTSAIYGLVREIRLGSGSKLIG